MENIVGSTKYYIDYFSPTPGSSFIRNAQVFTNKVIKLFSTPDDWAPIDAQTGLYSRIGRDGTIYVQVGTEWVPKKEYEQSVNVKSR
jgi:hypothetical protein